MEGVLFDLDGVITDTAKFHFSAWCVLAREKIGVELPADFEADLKGVSRLESLQRIIHFAGKTGVYSEAQIQTFATEKNTNYLKLINSLTKADILPGIKALLDELQQHGVKLAVASASNNAPIILDKLGLTAYFDTLVDPQQIKNGKPAPDIFLAAAQQLGIAPEHCVGLEDSIAGMTAINAAHAVSVLIGDPAEFPEADWVVPTTESLSYDLLQKAYDAR
ncbi:beta-phosphoglucomutase [Latilactobacillus sp. 5-91]|uniref:beta-phosphoglucomutase n=1 Tax=Latilactobacillus sp. 5-91 TaxID=3410924 RepID=UPI003C7602B6